MVDPEVDVLSAVDFEGDALGVSEVEVVAEFVGDTETLAAVDPELDVLSVVDTEGDPV